MILSITTAQHLQSLAAQILHNPSELSEMTVENLVAITQELNDIRLSMLADICRHETTEIVSLTKPEALALP